MSSSKNSFKPYFIFISVGISLLLNNKIGLNCFLMSPAQDKKSLIRKITIDELTENSMNT